MLGLIDSSQIKVSADQFHVTISRAQVKGSSRSSISETNELVDTRGLSSYKFTTYFCFANFDRSISSQFMVLNWEQTPRYIKQALVILSVAFYFGRERKSNI